MEAQHQVNTPEIYLCSAALCLPSASAGLKTQQRECAELCRRQWRVLLCRRQWRVLLPALLLLQSQLPDADHEVSRSFVPGSSFIAGHSVFGRHTTHSTREQHHQQQQQQQAALLSRSFRRTSLEQSRGECYCQCATPNCCVLTKFLTEN
jgi:hypothetical protein